MPVPVRARVRVVPPFPLLVTVPIRLEMTLLGDEENMCAEEPEEQVHDLIAIDSVGDE